MIHVDLIQAARGALFVLDMPLIDSRFDASARANALRKALAEFERLAEAPQPKKTRTKRIPAPVDPDEESPYTPARFMPLKRYTSAWRDTPRTICEVTFADGVRIRAYALRESGKPLDIGRPARAAVEKYRFRKPAGERTVTETGIFGGVSSRDHKKAKAQTRTYTIPVISAVPEIVELRDTETGDIFDIAIANTKTADMRRGA